MLTHNDKAPATVAIENGNFSARFDLVPGANKFFYRLEDCAGASSSSRLLAFQLQMETGDYVRD